LIAHCPPAQPSSSLPAVAASCSKSRWNPRNLKDTSRLKTPQAPRPLTFKTSGFQDTSRQILKTSRHDNTSRTRSTPPVFKTRQVEDVNEILVKIQHTSRSRLPCSCFPPVLTFLRTAAPAGCLPPFSFSHQAAPLPLPCAHPSQSQSHQAGATFPGDDGAVDAATRCVAAVCGFGEVGGGGVEHRLFYVDCSRCMSIA
jgi:hypothetical protein